MVQQCWLWEKDTITGMALLAIRTSSFYVKLDSSFAPAETILKMLERHLSKDFMSPNTLKMNGICLAWCVCVWRTSKGPLMPSLTVYNW